MMFGSDARICEARVQIAEISDGDGRSFSSDLARRESISSVILALGF